MKTIEIPKIVFLLFALVLVSCARNFEHEKFSSAEVVSYIDNLTTMRMQKDDFFRRGDSSPLTPEQRKTFQHLGYYPPNLDLIFRVKLINLEPSDSTGIAATGGELRPALKFGEFNFEVNGKKVGLHVYRMIGEDSDELFLPFTDETCGQTSYAGGRYIDLKEDSSGIYKLDFNYAYNPYCAYNHNFSCPIVPLENHINVPIAAGEKKFQ